MPEPFKVQFPEGVTLSIDVATNPGGWTIEFPGGQEITFKIEAGKVHSELTSGLRWSRLGVPADSDPRPIEVSALRWPRGPRVVYEAPDPKGPHK